MDGVRPASFLEKLSSSLSSSTDSFYHLQSELSAVVITAVDGFKALLRHDWGDGKEEEIYNNATVSAKMPDADLQIKTAELFDFGNQLS